MKDDMKPMDQSRAREAEIDKLLAELNYWEQAVRPRGDEQEDVVSTGEDAARIALLKRRLEDRGAVFRRKQGQYILERIASPGQGRQELDVDA